jgi:hypothetical protein
MTSMCQMLTSLVIRNVYYAGIKLFNTLPSSIKSLNHNIKAFKPALKNYLLCHSYSVEGITKLKIIKCKSLCKKL